MYSILTFINKKIISDSMKYIKFILFIFTILFIIQSMPINANMHNDKSHEYFILTIDSCNYLEHIQEFSKHYFLIQISSDCLHENYTFMINNRSSRLIGSIPFNSIEKRNVTINFNVFEIDNEQYYPCDLDNDLGIGSVSITYDRSTGYWVGDDYLGDASGYGRFNGCDDGSYDDFERDFELCFSIKIIDTDGDGIPSWYEENFLLTDPSIDNSLDDNDNDSIPLYWEYFWGYDPFVCDDHITLDSDIDGLCNYEEYLVSSWHSDPFRDDIFMELDQMEIGPNGEGALIPECSLIMIAQTYAKRNIVFHVDDGCMGGGDILPFDPTLIMGEGREYYHKYFLNNDTSNWKRGVFRYALFVYNHLPIRGMEFPGEHSILLYFIPGLNSFVLSTSIFNMVNRSVEESSAFMILHELGHTCGMCMGRPLGCDNQLMRFPWSLQNVLFKNYKSVMNYKYAYSILDYSDGSHGFGDYDDWGNLDLTYFQPEGSM
jgi:hypothetical protein